MPIEGRSGNSGPEMVKPVGGVIGDCETPMWSRLSTVDKYIKRIAWSEVGEW